jgi:hypothetical protein
MVCLTPVIISAWPAIMTFVAGAASALGFASVTSRQREEIGVEVNTVEVELKGSNVVEGQQGGDQQFTKDGISLVITTNECGRLVLRASGEEAEEVLREKLMSFAEKMQQAYSYHRAMTQLHKTGFNVVQEKVGEDKFIHITLKRF